MSTSSAWRSLRLALVALLVVAFGCQDASGPKLGYVPGGGDTTISAPAFSSPFALTAGRRVMTWSGSTAAVLALTTTTCAPGAELTIDVPPSTATSMAVSADLHVVGDWVINSSTHAVSNWDTSKRNLVMLACAGSQIVGASRILDPLDVTAPTVVSATVSAGAPSVVVVVYSEPVVHPGGSVAGLDVAVSVGTDRTITGIVSGDRTATVTYQMSGSFAGTETATFAIASGRVVADYSGNKPGVGSSAVTLSFTPATLAACVSTAALVYESGVAMLPASGLPALATSWTSQGTTTTQLLPPGASAPFRTAAPDAAMHFPSGADGSQRMIVALPSALSGDFAVMGRMKGVDVGGILGADVNGASGQIASFSLYWDGFVFKLEIDGSTVVADTVPVAAPMAAYQAFTISRVGTTWKLRTQAAGGAHFGTAVTATDATDLSTCTKFAIGNIFINSTQYQAGEGYLSDAVLLYGRDFTTLELDNMLARIAAR